MEFDYEKHQRDLLFHHIPKTGGGSVATMLAHTRKRLKNGQSMSAFKVYGAHTGFHEGRCFYERRRDTFRYDPFLITWLRHPVDILYSAYSYFSRSKRYRNDKSSRPRPPKGEPLETMIWTIQQHPNIESFVESPIPYPKGWWPSDISQFDFVGICEDMEKSISRLSEFTGENIKYNDARLNSSEYDRGHRPGEERLNKLFEKEIEEFEIVRSSL